MQIEHRIYSADKTRDRVIVHLNDTPQGVASVGRRNVLHFKYYHGLKYPHFRDQTLQILGVKHSKFLVLAPLKFPVVEFTPMLNFTISNTEYVVQALHLSISLKWLSTSKVYVHVMTSTRTPVHV